ncbi:uncharacterized protein LOC123412579 [Hordeum vulgare subsp. vulgare]|uniref:uncharacterized protein LOC123412579 n=1 Tax=Hordeum vulgare subsp. vulgare TaxID=112509 RepID=UPI001D1A49A4|nr:uncharacterized protein LOC123412579 [Hordeum vulgare subsp. vulgare]
MVLPPRLLPAPPMVLPPRLLPTPPMVASLRPAAPFARSQPDPPIDAPRSGMDYPSGVGPSRQMKADDDPGRSLTSLSCSRLEDELYVAAKEVSLDHFKEVVAEETKHSLTSLSCSILMNELYVAAKEVLFDHFKEVVADEITKVLCPQYDGVISQEPADTCESMERSMTPPHVSQMTTCEASSLAAVQNNSPYLALIWQSPSHITMVRLADDPSKQVEDFLSGNHTSERFGACYVAPVKSIQETSKKDMIVDLNDNFHFNTQQCGEHFSSSGIRESRQYHMKQKPLIVPNGKLPSDHASRTNVDTFPTSPLQKKGRTKLIVDLLNTAEAPCTSKSRRELKEKRLTYRREKEKFPTPCRSNRCARTSIDGWQWRIWSQNATIAEKDSVRGWNSTKQILRVEKASPKERSSRNHSPCTDARASRAKVRTILTSSISHQLANYIQMKARIKKLRVERSKIHGWGVLTVKEINCGELIVEYIGEVICKPVLDKRELVYEKAGICDYFFRIDADYVIDATHRGGIARYINHSCEPNCETRVILVNGEKKIFIYAKNKIKAGEELTYNYKFPFDEIKIPCLCGSKRCRGSMN